MRPIKLSATLLASLTGLICLLVYLRTLNCGFISYDDPDYVLNNPLIRSLDLTTTMTIFSQPYNGWWMPLTWLSLALDYRVWQLNPFGYHLTNILLHSINTGLVVLIAARILSRIRGEDGDAGDSTEGHLYPLVVLLAGLLWGLHPLRVESVAWVTERKDVLNGLFSLASILFYLRYAQVRDAHGRGYVGIYLVSLMMFALSLLAKSISVVLPVMLLVIDCYPLDRLRGGRMVSVLVEKIPFLLLSLFMALLTIRFSSQVGYLVSYAQFPFSQRLVVSGNALFEYCRLMLYPYGILPFYLIPDPLPAAYTLKTVLFAGGTLGCFLLVKKQPWLPAIWLLFVLPLLPVLAFFQNGDQALAARFTYLPSLAPTIGVVLLVAALCSKKAGAGRWKLFCGSGALLALLTFGAVTVSDIAVWHDPLSFWSRVIDRQPEVASYKERGLLYQERGDYRAAITDFSAAIGMAEGVWRRKIFNLYAFRGEAYRSLGRYPEAVRDFTAAIALYPQPLYFYYRGLALRQQGNLPAAEEDFARAGGASGALEWYEGDGQ